MIIKVFHCGILKNKTPQIIFNDSQSNVSCISFDIKNENIYAGTFQGDILSWDITKCNIKSYIPAHLKQWNFVEFASRKDEKLMISGSSDKTLKIWDLRSAKWTFDIKIHSASVNWAKLSPDGYWIASGSSDGNCIITDLRTGTIINWFEEHGQIINNLEFNPKTFTIAVWILGNGITYYDLESFDCINKIKFNKAEIKEIKFFNKKEFDEIDWVFFGYDSCIKLANCENKNQQIFKYSLPFEYLWDMQIDYKYDFLTWLWSNNNEIIYRVVNLPNVNINGEDKQWNKIIDGIPRIKIANHRNNLISWKSQRSSIDYKSLEIKIPFKFSYKNKEPESNKNKAIPPVNLNDNWIIWTKPSENETTFKLISEYTPAGIDFNEFSSKIDSKELNDIDEVLKGHFIFF